MHKLIFYMATCILYNHSIAQSKGGIEQYSYFNDGGIGTIMPVVHIENKAGWHSEVRYNYEEVKTFSFYAGKSFSKKSHFSWSITPMAGLLVGQLRGGSAAVNMNVECGRFFLSAMPEFIVATSRGDENFFDNWSELGFSITRWAYGGLTVQQTISGSGSKTQPGAMVGFQLRQVTIPVYYFNPFSRSQYLILGVNWEWNK